MMAGTGFERIQQVNRKVAAVHDISGFGRSSLTIALPVLSVMGLQACPLPTALLSTQTSGFDDYYYLDLTEAMKGIISHWKVLEISFDGVYSGFLGSSNQIDVVSDFIAYCQERGGPLVLVDPVMGDDGVMYGPITPAMVRGMRKLVGNAHVITPNYTEAALLLDAPFKEELEKEEIKELLRSLADLGPGHVIVTSVPVRGRRNFSSVYAYQREEDMYWKVECEYLPVSYPGTGDMFASVIMGGLLNGDSFPEAIDRAVQFVFMAVRTTYGKGIPPREGVLLERVLGTLAAPVPISTYEMVS